MTTQQNRSDYFYVGSESLWSGSQKTTQTGINLGAHGPAFFENSKGQLIPVPAVKSSLTSKGVNLPIRPKSTPDKNAASQVPTTLNCKKQPSVSTECAEIPQLV
jgi:hypothetical protein